MTLANVAARVPRPLLFVLAGLIQIALIAVMVFDRMQILRDGAEVTLQTRPVDPRDFLRGDYVVLSYDISELPAGALKDITASGKDIYVKLAPKADGVYEAVSVHADPVPVASGEVLIHGRLTYGDHCGPLGHSYCERLSITYGIEKFFVPEGEGRELESARNQGKVAIVAAVTPGGRAAIKRLLLDGKPVYDEPIF
jgi:GDYXXLXY protein